MLALVAQAASAQTGAATAPAVVGTITVCYYSPECSFANIPGIVHAPDEAQRMRDAGEHQGERAPASTGSAAPIDAPAFQFTNTGTTAITAANFGLGANASLGVVHDYFHIGTIKPGASFVIVPGASNDKRVHPAGSFFTYSAPGTPLDTSDSGPDDNSLKFSFTGKVGSASVSSGIIEPGKSAAPSTDGTVASINFLGGPGNADAPCSDCVAPKVVAKITVVKAAAAGNSER
jgi:hypothetical protein